MRIKSNYFLAMLLPSGNKNQKKNVVKSSQQQRNRMQNWHKDAAKVSLSKEGQRLCRASVDKSKIDYNKVKATDNHIKLDDPWDNLIEEVKRVGGDITVENGRVVSCGYYKSSGINESEILKDFGNRGYQFWARLVHPSVTFMPLTFPPDETRSRLDNAGIKTGFFTVTVGSHSSEKFYTQGKYVPPVQSKADYDRQYTVIHSEGYLSHFEPGQKLRIGGKEYQLSEDRKINVPYGEDIWDIEFCPPEEA